MERKKYLSIVSACEADLERYGDNYRGVGWTKSREDVDTRYGVMLDVIRKNTADKIKLLDFGCGASHLYEYILRNQMTTIDYSGLDLSERFIALSRSKYPRNAYYCVDVLSARVPLPTFDYIVMNGVFNFKGDLTFSEMFMYLQTLICRVFPLARVGIAFNVMSKQVDWEREDLFHLPFDMLGSFLRTTVSRYFILRHDYGLYEYTTYVYKG
jgi:SAM-dependent methyltransferase